jgi:hypothetical protein
VDTSPYFKASDKITDLPIHRCRVIVEKYHLLVVGYVDDELQPNRLLSLIKPSSVWKGELALFQLGKLVPTLSTIRCPTRFLLAAIRT